MRVMQIVSDWGLCAMLIGDRPTETLSTWILWMLSTTAMLTASSLTTTILQCAEHHTPPSHTLRSNTVIPVLVLHGVQCGHSLNLMEIAVKHGLNDSKKQITRKSYSIGVDWSEEELVARV
jgi:hypothetical protein